jgi:hypothetical protein
MRTVPIVRLGTIARVAQRAGVHEHYRDNGAARHACLLTIKFVAKH